MQSATIPTFDAVNSTLTFLKPELRLFLSDMYNNRGHPFIPRSFITLIDIEQRGWTEEQRTRFYTENFTQHYDIIECSVKQLPSVIHMCKQKGQNSFPRVLIIHVNNGETTVELPTRDVGFFIVVGDVQRFSIPEDDDHITIFHHRDDLDSGSSFYVDGEQVENLKLDYNTSHDIRASDTRLQGELMGSFRPAGQAQKVFPNAAIRRFGPNDQLGDGGKESYIISGDDAPKGSTTYASVVAPREGGISITDVKNQGELSSQTKEVARYIIIHGRLKSSRIRQMIRLDAFKKIYLFFPDMSQKEIDSILLDQTRLFGNDRKLKSSKELTGSIPSLYFTDGFTFSEYMLYSLSVEPQEERKNRKTATEILLERRERERDPKEKSAFQMMLDKRNEGAISCLSYVDNYLDTVRVKYPNDFFQYMITRYAAELHSLRIDFNLLRGKPITYSLVAVVKERLQSESQVDSNRREIMLARIKGLAEHKQYIPPYYLEAAIDDPVLSEEQRFHSDRDIKRQHNPLTHYRRWFNLKGGQSYVLSDINYLVVDGKGYDCVIQNCGFVILKGEGTVRISGTLHSLVSYGAIVTIKLDNVSPMPFNPAVFLFTENGSIYDTITNFQDNLDIKVIDTILAKRTETQMVGKEVPILVLADVEETPAPVPRPSVFGRSVVRNLYVSELPMNYKTAMIENLHRL